MSEYTDEQIDNFLAYLATISVPVPTVDIIRQLRKERDEAWESKNNAYSERNHLVAALARLFPSAIMRTNIHGWNPEWHGCVYINLPSGQISYHYHDDEHVLFADLPPFVDQWDGHDKAEVHRRLATLNALNVGKKLTQ